MTFMIIAYILDLIVHDFVMNLCSEWLLLPVLAQELDDIAFAFGWGQKKPPLLYFVASDDVAEKNTAIWPTVDSFVIFDGFIKVYIKYHVDKETLCSSTWCRHENGFWKLSEGLVIAVNVVNKAHSIDDASWRLQYRFC